MARSLLATTRLEAVALAKHMHRELDLQRRVIEGKGLVDVFESISELGIPLIFKPLNSALGLCLPAPLRGIIITTRRGLHIQRFTAAHELGHIILGHKGSIDREILERGPMSSPLGRDLQEVAADAFAAEFLLPRWLYRHHIRTQGWTVDTHLRNPDVIYQLALRMGTSYEATCWGLVSHQIVNKIDVNFLRKASVAKLKNMLGGQFRPGNSWSDVWRLTKRDSGVILVGNRDDLLRIELDEAAANGYQWQVEVLEKVGCTVLEDKSEFAKNPLKYGSNSQRTLIVRPPENGWGDVTLHEVQPWMKPSFEDEAFSISFALDGPETGGYSRADRRRLGLRP